MNQNVTSTDTSVITQSPNILGSVQESFSLCNSHTYSFSAFLKFKYVSIAGSPSSVLIELQNKIIHRRFEQ